MKRSALLWLAQTRHALRQQVAFHPTAPQHSEFYGGILGPQIPEAQRFALNPALLAEHRLQRPPFGFNGLGEVVYLRTYAREREDGTTEGWGDTVERVVAGTFEVLQHHCVNRLQGRWDAHQAAELSEDMFRRMFAMKFLPPGRGLWAMGAPIVRKKGFAAALNNCGFVSTAHLERDPARPFLFVMDQAMLGVGVGFDTAGAGSITIPGPDVQRPTVRFAVPDTREGWVESARLLLEAHLCCKPAVDFDYSLIRPAGSKLKTFGGTSAGPKRLMDLHKLFHKILSPQQGKRISVTCITDLMNAIGACVVAGNNRYPAEIAFGEADCEEFLNLKDYSINPQRQEFGWASTNTILAEVGMDYEAACQRVRVNGEPGFAWLSNMQSFSRMGGEPDHADHRVRGGPPCLEQSLEPNELCCLVETFPDKHADRQDFQKTLRCALLFAKAVTLLPQHWPESNEVMQRNRRIGCSVSGIAQFIAHRGLHELRSWLQEGYQTLQEHDRHVSEWLCIRQSIKLTSVKPSGTVSLVAGATPGVHYPEASFYLRRVRMVADSPLLSRLALAGFHTEPCAVSPATTAVVEFPIAAGQGLRTVGDVSMWEQLSLAAFMQRYWADNQVSVTVTFDPDTEGPQIRHALEYFQYQLKGVSFLPRRQYTYQQMPYEAISEEAYRKAIAKVNFDVPLSTGGGDATLHGDPPRFCDNDRCLPL